MTTYASPTTYQAPPAGGRPGAPPQAAGRAPTQRPLPPRRPAGIITAAAAFGVAVTGTVVAAFAFTRPLTPAQHTVNVVPSPSAAYSASEIQAARATACTAWDQAARSTAQMGKASAAIEATTGPASTEAHQARSVEKRTMVSEIAYLRTQLAPETPADVRTPIGNWIAAQIDSMHGVNMRDWSAANAAITRGNDLVDVIDAKCGLR